MTNNNQTEQETEVIIIPDENGNEEHYEVIMEFEVDQTGKNYIMLVPLDQEDTDEEEQEEVFVFRSEDEGEELKLFTIDDEKEWEIVEETFNTILAEFDEEDEA
ncbi:DUF1292 domain-containing protein [Longirhabdus pacifica]|uniref:DUF1292 domain-containing protein n=1 Tax=Longirhabdus pacifica TaxID=2305227 RepID=UPI0010089C43|nr:DUF1292 domain-containing protein [Longirhabdus pacifica]